MNYLNYLIITAILSFIATNLDDILVLMLFFSTKKPTTPLGTIIIGKYLGFTLIILASLAGFVGGLFITKNWLGFLGLIPIFIGVQTLFNRENEDDIQLTNHEKIVYNPWQKVFKKFLNPSTLYIASVTFANGGDNVSIYLSLFSQNSFNNLLIILIIYYLMLALWIFLAYWFTSHRLIAKVFVKYGQILTPFILIALGIYIFISMETINLFLNNNG